MTDSFAKDASYVTVPLDHRSLTPAEGLARSHFFPCAGRLLHPQHNPSTLRRGLLENPVRWSKRPAQAALTPATQVAHRPGAGHNIRRDDYPAFPAAVRAFLAAHGGTGAPRAAGE